MQGYSLGTAFALSNSVWMAEWIYALLNESEYGNVEGNALGLVLSSSATYGFLTNTDWDEMLLSTAT